MSRSQLKSRGDKYEIPQYRRRAAAGRSGETQSNFSTVGGGDGAGMTNGIEPLPPTSSATSGEKINYVQQGGKFGSYSPDRALCGTGDPSESLQFGSISPGFIKGMKIGAQANSAPQDMDEQARYQAQHVSLRGDALTSPTPSVFKLQWRKKGAQPVDQSNSIEPHSISKEKSDAHVPAPQVMTQLQKSFGHPFSDQPEAPVQCGDMKSQMQSLGSANSSMPMPIPTPFQMGNPPLVQQQVFAPCIQPHPMLPPGTMRQDRGPHVAPHMGNMGINKGPRYQQQQSGKYGGPSKAEKISPKDLSEGLVTTSDKAEASTASNVNASHGSYPSPGRVVDRPFRGPEVGCGSSCIGEDDKCGLEAQGKDLCLDIGHGGNVQGLQRGVGWNCDVSKDLCEKPHFWSGPMQSGGLQRGMRHYKVMRKTSRKREVQDKQRQLKGILDKLTPQNMERVLYQIKQVNIDNANTLSGFICQIYFKAVMKPSFCTEMYATLCHRLAGELPNFGEENGRKITFRRVLLNLCQMEFERGEREREGANRAEEGEVKQPEAEKEEKRINWLSRVLKLGNIQFIGELYKKQMLSEMIIHVCIKKLLGECDQHHGEEDIEALCKLMTTVGKMIEHPKSKERKDAYFEKMSKLSDDMKLSARMRLLLMDVVEQRNNNWPQQSILNSAEEAMFLQ